tara:strand:+ start:1238 stop:3253 length:2016 start_codon:yes stop_codon:yes gene_type:complete
MPTLADILQANRPRQVPSPLGQNLLGMDPNAKRMTLLPYPQQGADGNVDMTDWVAPQMMADFVEAIQMPGQVYRGERAGTPEEARKMAVDVNFGSALLGRGAAPAGALGMNVWHGGPNKWAPEPDYPQGRPRLDKMGTGEGNQAYGHGFYSAEAKDVGQGYKSGLSGQHVVKMPDGAVLRPEDIDDSVMREAVSAIATQTPESAPKWLRDVGLKEAAEKADDLVSRGAIGVYDETGGTLYKLDLPDEDVAKYLDWDAPLTEMPESVQTAVRAMPEFKRFERASSELSVDDLAEFGIKADGPMGYTPTGRELQESMERTYGRVGTARAFRKAGIPGLKYYDGTSRLSDGGADAKGTATRILDAAGGNYDKAIEIAKGRQARNNKGLPDPMSKLSKAIKLLENKFDTRTRNFVTWDQDVLNRTKMMERNGETLAENLSGKLPMDEASRMARAKEMGFDTDNPVYHGTPDARGVESGGFSTAKERYNDATSPNGPFFFTNKRGVANTYADETRSFDYQNAEPKVIEAFIKQKNPLVVDAKGESFRHIDVDDLRAGVKDTGALDKILDDLYHHGDVDRDGMIGTDGVGRVAEALGHDGFVIKNVKDSYTGDGPTSDVFAVFGAKNIRKPDATFDPAKRNSADLLASNPGDPLSAAAALQKQFEDKQILKFLETGA